MKFSGAAGNRAWLAILFALILPQPLLPQAQNMQFEHLTIEDGLSQNTVRCILQDRLGFMWFGTDDDLNKFDGYRFTHYKNRHGDATTLSNNTINVIYEDKSGTLWIGTNGGLNRFDRRSETFRHFRHDPNNPNSLHDNIVSAIYEDAAGTLWIGTQKGLNKMDRSTPGQETFTRYQHRFGEYDDPIIQWVQGIGEYVGEYDSLLFVGSWGAGLLRFDRKTERYSQCPLPYVSSEFELRRWISGIHVDRAGDIWVANDDIHKYDPQMGTFRTVFKAGFTDNSAHALRVHKSALGELIIGTSAKGLVLLDGELKISTRLRHNPNDPNSLSDDRITAIYEDNTGTIWIGTKKGGINKYDPRGKRFTGYRFYLPNSKGLNDDNIIATLSTSSGSILVTFKNYGLYVLDHQRKTMIPYPYFFRNAGDQNRFSIKTIYQDSAGRIWLGDWGLGLYQYSSDDPDAKLVHHFRVNHDDSTTLIDDFVGAICESREGELWIGTSLGVSVIRLEDLAKGKFKNYRHNPNDSASLGDLRADVILQDHLGQIWIGSHGGGLSLFNRQTDSFVRFKHNPYDANSLNSDVVLSIFQDSQNRLWVGTRGGLNRFDYETRTFIHYTEADGLPNAVINGIVEDAHANLWISTNNGLSKFNPDRKTFKNYDVNDGLPSREFHSNAIYKNVVTGEIIVRGPRGLTVFHPDSIQDNDLIPPVVITSFKRYNVDRDQASAIEEKGITARDHLELSYKDNILTFEIAALSYRNAAKNQYAYKLAGFNDNWIQLGTKREMTFTNLDPGEYTLHVKGSNNDGVWNEAGTSLEITITPPWWQTWWAYTLYGVMILGFLYGIRRYEMNRQQWKHGLEIERVESEKLKELDSLKSRFFANISHEFRTPLTLILGPVDNMLQRLNDKASQKDLKMMQRNANR
ncbi:MAG: two-component regulator propeller domain-containing protein, partial [bacterium]